MVKNGCCLSDLWNLKLADGIKLFFTCWYKFTQIKRWRKILGLGIVKNGYDQSGHGIFNMAVSQKWTDRIN